MNNRLQLKTNHKIVIGIVVGLVFLSGLLALIYKYYSVVGDVSQQVSKNPLQEAAANLAQPGPAIDSIQLAVDYKQEATAIINSFLEQSVDANSLAVSSKSAQEKLLVLKVPAEDKAKHLGMVLLLGEISDSAQAGQTKTAQRKLAEFKDLVKQ